MSPLHSVRQKVHKLLQHGDLPFRDFVEVALYEPGMGYYCRAVSPAGKTSDFVTSPLLSPVFSWALARLIAEFMSRMGDAMCTMVDIGCGDGTLIRSLAAAVSPEHRRRVRWVGVDRSLDRVARGEDILFSTDLSSLPPGDAQLLFCNELFDALPFARVVQRDDGLHELCVTEENGGLGWSERDADPRLRDYFDQRGVELQPGQFADISLDWTRLYGELCSFVSRGIIVTFDYGYEQRKLFSGRVRQFGTAAAYRDHQVSRDLLANPGEQDLTAHINFTDLERAGERAGFSTLYFDRQAKFLLALGAAEHELFAPANDRRFESAEEALNFRERREEARRLILPDGIGEEIRVLVQGKNVDPGGWTFQRKLY